MRRVVPLLVLFLLISCARERGTSEGETGTAEAGVPRHPSFVIAVAQEPDQLVPPFARSAASAAIWPWILPALVRVDCDSAGRGEIVGDMASSWQSEEGGRAVRFFLDPARYWEDTTAVSVEDVIETYRLYRTHAWGGPWIRELDEILSIEAPSSAPGTILFRYRRPLARLRALQLASLPVISSAQWAKSKVRRPLLGEPERLVQAAGPFRVVEWRRGEYLRLERHPFPPPGRSPKPERVLLRFAPSGRSRSLMVEYGEADCAIDLPVEEVVRLRDEAPQVRIVRAGPAEIEGLVWNLDHPIWGRWSLRRALFRTIDRAGLRRVAAAGFRDATGEESAGFLPSSAGREEAAEADTLPMAFDDAPVADDKKVAGDAGAAGGANAAGNASVSGGANAAGNASASGGAGAAGNASAAGDANATDNTVTAADALAPDTTLAPEDTLAGPDVWAFGTPSLELLYSAADRRKERMAVELSLQLRSIGVGCELRPCTEEGLAQRLEQSRFDATLLGWSIPVLPDIGDLWGSTGARNTARLSDASVDSLIAWARSAAADTVPDAWQRVEERAQSRFVYLVIGRRVRFDALGSNVKAFRPNPHLPYGDLLAMERGR